MPHFFSHLSVFVFSDLFSAFFDDTTHSEIASKKEIGSFTI